VAGWTPGRKVGNTKAWLRKTARWSTFGYGIEVVAVDAGFVGEDAGEMPLSVGNAIDEQFFGGADGLVTEVAILAEDLELVGVFAGGEGVGGGEAVFGGVAAGVGFAGVSARPVGP
jgi:hypothetical protein